MKKDIDLNNNEQSAFKKFIDKNFSGKVLSNGLYSMVMLLVVIVAVVILNIVIGKLELKADITTDKLYSITDDTKDYLKKVKDDIIIYYITSPSAQDTQIFELVEKYEKYGKNIKVEVKDPVVYPKFVATYDEEVTNPNNNSILVVNKGNDKFKYLDYSSLVQSEFNYETYQYEITGVDVEGQLTSAINFVTSDKNFKLYLVKGHGETESFGTKVTSLLAKQNIETDVIETATGAEIPEDCSGLVINAPLVDYTEEEVEKIKTYVDAGNPLLVLTGDDYEGSLPNFEGLLAYYGIKKVEGLVVETNSSYCLNGYAQLIKVDTDSSNEITATLPRLYTVFPNAEGLKPVEDLSEYITIADFLTTSDGAFAVTDTTLALTDISDKNSVAGPFSVGSAITKTYNDVESKVVVLGSSLAFNEEALNLSSFANGEVLINSINWLCDLDEEAAVAIDVKENSQVLVTFDNLENVLWLICLILILPLGTMVGGFVVWSIRRKR